MSNPTPTWETIDPKQAEQMLRQNVVNRHVREQKVKQYMRDMVNDRWNEETGEPIIFDTEGNLVDGQHRLTALLKAGKTMKFLVVRGVNKRAQRTINTGAPRTVADQLHIEQGQPNAALLAAIARNVYRIENDMMAGGTTISTEEILDTIERHPELAHSTEIAAASRGGRSLTPIAPNILGAGHWMIREVNGQAEADMFIWRVINLQQEREGSPVLALARRCNEIKRQQQRVPHRWFLSMLIKTWNYDVEGKSVMKISTYSKSGQYILPEVLKRQVGASQQLDDLLEEDEVHDDKPAEAS